MSTSPERTASPEDRIIGLLSHWLARHVDNARLCRGLEQIGTDGLGAGEAEAVEELLVELRAADQAARAALEPLVRETIEALALGV